MKENLDKDRIKALLEEADLKWHALGKGGFDYRGHLDFISGYLVKNYHKCRKKVETVEGQTNKQRSGAER